MQKQNLCSLAKFYLDFSATSVKPLLGRLSGCHQKHRLCYFSSFRCFGKNPVCLVPELRLNLLKHLGAQAVEDRVSPQARRHQRSHHCRHLLDAEGRLCTA